MTEIELSALVRGALHDLAFTPGVLADWLEEHDDPRGPLLRRRWRQYTYFVERATEGKYTRAVGGHWHHRSGAVRLQRADDDFYRYICRKFPEAHW